MILKRVIPVLLMINKGLYKTVKFDKPLYVGDPLNAVKIFNEKEVDELILLDLEATKQRRDPDYDFLQRLAGECFMPLTYGGGIRTIDQIRTLNACGIEKVSINSAAVEDSTFVQNAADTFGSSTIVISVDVKRDLFGNYKVYTSNGRRNTGISVLEHISKMEQLGAGEIILTSIDKEGTYKGYDLPLVKMVADHIQIPLIAHGGASLLQDFGLAIRAGASAVAAGSLFVYKGPHKAVLINYPDRTNLDQIIG